jgi:ABC-type uncharacterized transport system auxiliary subunit
MQPAALAKIFCVAVVAFGLGGCSKQKEQAEAEVTKIDDACRAGDGEKARTLMLDAAKTNEVFRRAFEAATKDVPDKNRINACGLVLTEIKTRLKHS